MAFLTLNQTKPWMVAARLEKHSLLFAVNCLAGMSIFFFGYDQGLMAGVNQSTDYIYRMGLGHLDQEGSPVITETLLQGGIMAIFYLGTLVGCLAGGAFGDKYGRIGTVGVGACWAVFGGALQSAAMNPSWVLGSRFVNGIGTGILNGIVPTWASELSEHHSRGTFIAMEFTLNIFGVVVAYWLAYRRFPIAFQILPLILLHVACWAFPESPRWLVKGGRDQEALYILGRLRGKDAERNGAVRTEYNDIRNAIELEKSAEGTSYTHMLFGTKSGRLHTARRVQLVIWLQIIQCWTGIAGVTMYGPTIFHIAGFGPSKTQWVAGLNNIFYMFSTLICVFTIDQIGRRWTLYWGSVSKESPRSSSVDFHEEAWMRAKVERRRRQPVGSRSGVHGVPVHFYLRRSVAYRSVTLQPAEIFPIHIRAKGNAWGVVGWSIGNGILTLLLPYIVSAINEKMMYIFAAVNVLSIPIVWALYPELNQRTLEVMDLLFAVPSPWAWEAERTFAALKEESGMVRVKDEGNSTDLGAKGDSSSSRHVDNTIDDGRV